ncbi:MAG: TonB-dependent receptor [Devosiaceae bacterium]|nr:TonB-dependent receptor [Devosiaceae bacterium MH13]
MRGCVTQRLAVLSVCAALCLPLALSATPAIAQSEITVFAPMRGIATPIARAGSAVSVVTREQIEQAGYLSVSDALRAVPGVSFNTSGGYGSETSIRLRGAESHHTVVLIDGVPVSDPTDTRAEFDFRTLPTSAIERIEVLRGPQSALYGSDAIGGVINIITRRADQGLSGEATVEGGSYGTHRETATVGYGGALASFLGSVSHVSTEGFSRTQVDPEKDGVRQWSGFAQMGVQLSEYVRVDGQLQASDTTTDYDRTPTRTTGTQDRVRDMRSVNGHLRARVETFEERWVHTLTVSGGRTENVDDSGSITNYSGLQQGAEYVSTMNFGAAGTLLVGMGIEQHEAEQTGGFFGPYDAQETYWSAFAMHQFSIGPRLHLSAAIRLDDFDGAGEFVTGRGTAVFEIFETETRFHASVGTGAKAPTLYQRFGPIGANPDLLVEESFGADLGITQVLFDGRATVDVTGFYNRFDNLIDYQGGFINVDEAETYGVEVSATARVIPGQLDASASYTYLIAKDLTTGNRLRRRPEHEGQLTLTYLGIDRLSLSATAFVVGGDRFNDFDNLVALDPYVRVDASASYQVHEHLEVFGRIENLFDADYEEIDGYNTPGLSAYAGIRARL